jgi:type VI secretion system protein ImpM
MADTLIGWYGKLPGLGDFVMRQLPEEFVKPWDTWLQEGMLQGKSNYGEQWEEHYLTFPIWRFLLGKSLLNDSMWMGLLMPSADRVGRLFPFTVAVELPRGMVSATAISTIDQELDALQTLVTKLLEDDAIDQFELALAELSFGKPADPHAEQSEPDGLGLFDLERPHQSMPLSSSNNLQGLMSSLALRELFHRGMARSIWWVAPNGEGNGIVRASPSGLDPSLFVDLVRGVA